MNGDVYGTVNLITREPVDLARSRYMMQQLGAFFSNRWVVGVFVILMLILAMYITLQVRYRKARIAYIEERKAAEERRRKRQQELEEKRRSGWDL